MCVIIYFRFSSSTSLLLKNPLPLAESNKACLLQFLFFLKRRLHETWSGFSSAICKYLSWRWKMRSWLLWCIFSNGFLFNIFNIYEVPWFPSKLSIIKSLRHYFISFLKYGVKSLRSIKSSRKKYYILTLLSYWSFSCSFFFID